MTKLQKKSLEELLRLDSGLTNLFSSGITETLASSTDEDAANLFSVLRLQNEIQSEIRQRILQVIPLYKLETAPTED